ncbi:deoxyguanosinetriphosphate triphosphohydrolase family protein [candidate division KSB1 bacterium]
MNTDSIREIIINNLIREKKTLSRYACKSNKGLRKYPDRERIPDRENIRPVFFHDTDRIIHSLAYARYIDKTQVFSFFENDHITHRVLHVQFVSKIGRVIGRCLRLNEDLIEAISLGHDLGHVPLGHTGENILNDICEKNKIGHFYHNAQSVRFLREIEQRGEGLNLSLQVLDGILAHNGEILDKKYSPVFEKDWTEFESEYDRCFKEKDYYKEIIPMTLEGCVVRISDIIAYIGRDIEDAITVKLIKRKNIPDHIKKVLGNSNDRIINALAMDIIQNSYGKPYLEFSDKVYKAFDALKEFNNENIYNDKRIRDQDGIVEFMFKELYKCYYKDINNNNKESSITKHFLKGMNQDYCTKTNKKRIVIDYIAGMTDDFFINEFKSRFVPQSYGYAFEKKE